MLSLGIALVTSILLQCEAISIHESDINFRVEAGTRTCFFEHGAKGQTMEAHYQVLDGQHGDLDISFEVIDPTGTKIVSDIKRSQNSIIMDLTADGDYVFCMDNTHSSINSKLVFVYVLIENKEGDDEAEVSVVEDGEEKVEEEVVEWAGVDADGVEYYVEVPYIAASLSRTLRHVVAARHELQRLGATQARDSYLAFEDTFIVDVWSGFQICFMFLVGTLQVYMIKSLFNKPAGTSHSMY